MRRPALAPPEQPYFWSAGLGLLPSGAATHSTVGLGRTPGPLAGNWPALVLADELSGLLAARDGFLHGVDSSAQAFRLPLCVRGQPLRRAVAPDALGRNPL